MKNRYVYILFALMLLAMPMAAKKPSPYPGWVPVKISTGDRPEGISCREVTSNIENYLLLQVGGSVDAIIKVRSMVGDTISPYDPVIRVVYVKAGDSYKVRNLPEVVCYLEVAYGNGFYRSEKNKKRQRFMADNYFVCLTETFDFKVMVDTLPDGAISTKTPCFSMYLQMTLAKSEISSSTPANLRSLQGKEIEEDDFFK